MAYGRGGMKKRPTRRGSSKANARRKPGLRRAAGRGPVRRRGRRVGSLRSRGMRRPTGSRGNVITVDNTMYNCPPGIKSVTSACRQLSEEDMSRVLGTNNINTKRLK